MNQTDTIEPAAAASRIDPKAPSPDRIKRSPDRREWLSFKLGEEEYGVEILRVQEIRGYEKPTRIAGAPDCVLGVLNLRGVIVPIIDLRCRLALEPRFDALTVTVVLNVEGRVVGAVVDSVSDVVELSMDQIKPAPEFNASAGPDHVVGIGAMREGDRDRMLILLDIEGLLSSSEGGLTNTELQ